MKSFFQDVVLLHYLLTFAHLSDNKGVLDMIRSLMHSLAQFPVCQETTIMEEDWRLDSETVCERGLVYILTKIHRCIQGQRSEVTAILVQNVTLGTLEQAPKTNEKNIHQQS